MKKRDELVDCLTGYGMGTEQRKESLVAEIVFWVSNKSDFRHILAKPKSGNFLRWDSCYPIAWSCSLDRYSLDDRLPRFLQILSAEISTSIQQRMKAA